MGRKGDKNSRGRRVKRFPCENERAWESMTCQKSKFEVVKIARWHMAWPFLPDSDPIAPSSHLIIGSTPSTLTMSLVMSWFYCSNCLGNVLEHCQRAIFTTSNFDFWQVIDSHTRSFSHGNRFTLLPLVFLSPLRPTIKTNKGQEHEDIVWIFQSGSQATTTNY